jgi:hypothetical protein
MISDLASTIPAAEVRRLLGYPSEHAIPARVRLLLDQLLAESSSLLEPRGVCARLAPSEAAALQLPLPAPEQLPSSLALGLVTIGPRLEARASAALDAGKATEALLLDTIGSAAVEAAADAYGNLLAPADEGEAQEAGDGCASGCRISPGYGGWPLTAQEAIFARLPHEAIGVRLLPSMLMVPRKSISFALWFDTAGRVVAGRGGCAVCELDPCPWRASRPRGDLP